MKSIAMIHFLR